MIGEDYNAPGQTPLLDSDLRLIHRWTMLVSVETALLRYANLHQEGAFICRRLKSHFISNKSRLPNLSKFL